MKRVAIIIALGLALGGCWCKGCHGAEVWTNDLVIDATEAKEFKSSIEDFWNLDTSAFADMIFLLATGSETPTGTGTVTINTAQSNRWFNTQVPASCMSRIYWRLGRLAVNQHKALRPMVMSEAEKQAAIRIESPTSRDRFVSRLKILSATGEEY